MNKLISLALLMLTSSCFASGFYVGGQVGISFLESKETTVLPDEQHNLGGYGVMGGGFAGYKLDLCKFDIGVEGFVFGNSAQNKIVHHENSTRFKVSEIYNWGFRVLPGYYLIDNVEAHFIGGYTCGNFCIKDNGVYGTIARNFYCNGFQVGGGITVDLTCHLSMRFDGVYNGYTSKRLYGLTSLDLPNRYRIKPYDFDGTASIVYTF